MFPQMNGEKPQNRRPLLNNDAVYPRGLCVIVAYCHSNPIIHKCFGTISDYTESCRYQVIYWLKDGFIDKLNADGIHQ